MAVESTTFSSSKSLDDMVKKIEDFKTSDKELYKAAQDVFGKNGSEEGRRLFSMALQNRQDRATAWSMMMRAIGDLHRTLIQNIRL